MTIETLILKWLENAPTIAFMSLVLLIFSLALRVKCCDCAIEVTGTECTDCKPKKKRKKEQEWHAR